MPNPFFDTGFSHTYPYEKGLIEELLEDQRVIIERKLSDQEPLFANRSELTFPVRSEHRYNYYLLPPEARDLSSYLRLIRTRGQANATGIGALLGSKLLLISEQSGSVPSDTIVDRFSVIHSSNTGLARFGGIDLRLLPPYSNIDAPLDSVHETLQSDVANIGGDAEVMQAFVAATVEVIRHDA